MRRPGDPGLKPVPGENLSLKLNIYFVNLKEKFSPGPGFESGSPALRAGALTD